MSSRRILLSVSAIVFVAGAAMTIATCVSMSAMGKMPMPGGWTMSHMWMVMPGQSLSGATASFVGMWAAMMVAMMMPSLTPSLLAYQESLGHRAGQGRGGALTALAGVGYFIVWTAVGVTVFPLGVAVAGVTMRDVRFAHAAPIVGGSALVAAGLVQLWTWRAQFVARCLDSSSAAVETRLSARAAWRHGLCLGVHCVRSCAGLTVVALCLGVMDLRVMAAVAGANAAERRWHVVGRLLVRPA